MVQLRARLPHVPTCPPTRVPACLHAQLLMPLEHYSVYGVRSGVRSQASLEAAVWHTVKSRYSFDDIAIVATAVVRLVIDVYVPQLHCSLRGT